MKRFFTALTLVLGLALSSWAGTRPLKEDTPVTIVIGPFVDDTGAAQTALTVSNIDCNLYKNDGTKVDVTLAASGTSNDCVHVEDGYYSLELTATDTSTAGYLRVTFQIAGALLVHEDFDVQPLNIYDSLYGNDKLQVDVIAISGDGTAADNAGRFFDGTGYGVHIRRDAVVNVVSQTNIEISMDTGVAGALNGCTVVLQDDATPARGVRTIVSSSSNPENTTNITLDSAPPFMIGGNDIVEILPPGFAEPDRTAQTDIKTRTDFLPIATAGEEGGLATLDGNLNVQADLEAIDDDTTAPANLETMLDGTGGSTLSLKNLVVNNSTGTAVSITAGVDGYGLDIAGAGLGAGLRVRSGAGSDANAIEATSLATNGSGIHASGAGSQAGFLANGGLTGPGVQITGGATSGRGIYVTTLDGHAVEFDAAGSSKHGFVINGGDSGTSDGLNITAGTGGVDFRGNITGNLSGSVGSVLGAVGSISGVTFPANFAGLIITSGRVDANVTHVLGDAVCD